MTKSDPIIMRTRTSMATINRRVAAKIRHMTPEKARDILAGLEPKTMYQPLIRELTGGFNSQSINGAVIAKLSVKAGYRRPL